MFLRVATLPLQGISKMWRTHLQEIVHSILSRHKQLQDKEFRSFEFVHGSRTTVEKINGKSALKSGGHA